MRSDSAAGKVRMASLDELLGCPAQKSTEQASEEGKVVRLPLRVLHTYHSHPHGHPFRVLDDEKMAETVESIRIHGVLQPGIVRPDKDYPGEYELVSGNRRRRASELAGESDMPVIIRDMTDDEATVIMVDANLQREDMLPSELAWAYRMKYEALKAMGMREDVRKDAALAKEMGTSRATIQRYIRLTYLHPRLLKLVDEGRLSRNPAVDLSYLKQSEQLMLDAVMEDMRLTPDGRQAERLHQLSRERMLDFNTIRQILKKPEETAKVSLSSKKVREYFPESYTGEQIQSIIYELLEEWRKRELNTV